MLFIPAIKKQLFDKILYFNKEDKPDGIIFDLEDSIHEDYKNEARTILLKKFLNDVRYRTQLFDKYHVFIRINAYKSKWFRDDIKIVNKIKPNFLMLSKVETEKEIEDIRKKSKVPQIFAVIETFAGIKNREKILKTLKKIDLFAIGYEDLSAELFIERPENLNSITPLSLILMESIIDARKNKITMIDAVSRKFSTHQDLNELKKECLFTANLNMSGKVAIHPNQISVINSIFDKNLLLKRARHIISEFKKIKDGSFVIKDTNKGMLDTPSCKMYSEILNLLNNGVDS